MATKPTLKNLEKNIKELEEETIKGKQVEETLQKRVKELHCLYSISNVIEKVDSINELFQKIINQIPEGLYYSERACARITWKAQEFKTQNFRETEAKASADIVVLGKPIGVLEVCYLMEIPDRDQSPFHKEELHLIAAIAQRLGRVLEHKRAEKALQDNEKLFKNLFEQHAAIMLIIDPANGNIIDANPQAVKFYGWPREQLIKKKIQDINILLPEEIKREMEKARLHKRVHFEFRHRRADGSIRDVDVFSSNIDVRGKELLYSIIHDITERKQLEEEREKLISELQQTLLEVKTLSGLLPICSSCKKIRNDEGYWEQIEDYIRKHSQTKFSHGICPECAKKLYPEFYQEK